MYLDPGSWSMVVQALIGTIVAIPILMGIYWKQVKAFFRKKKKGASSESK